MKLDKPFDKSMIPKLFSNRLISITYRTNVDCGIPLGYFNILFVETVLQISKSMSLYFNYTLDKEGNTDMKLVLHQGKCTKPISYSCKDRKIEIDPDILIILDKLELERNQYYKNILGILINNIVWQTKKICNYQIDYEEDLINVDQIGSRLLLQETEFIKVNGKYQIAIVYQKKLLIRIPNMFL